MLARLITQSKNLQKNLSLNTEKIQHFIDKYHVIKRFYVVGTVINLYFLYHYSVKYMIMSEIQASIGLKVAEWDQNRRASRQMTLELIEEVDRMQREKIRQSGAKDQKHKQPQQQSAINTAKNQSKSSGGYF